MKRFSRLPSLEELEEKRLKAADFINHLAVHDSPTEAAATSNFQIAGASKAILTSEQANEDSDNDNEENETDDDDESDDIDQSDSTELDEQDESETDETDESGSDESDVNESDDDDSDDNETDHDSDETDEQDSDNDNESDDDEANDNDDSGDDNETELSSDLSATTGNSGSGTAEFESESDNGATEREFALEVKGATTNSSLVTGTEEVRVGGVLVGSIDLTNGDGKLEFSSDPNDDESAFPANFPGTVDSTTVVAVGPVDAPILTGTFGTSSDVESLSAFHSTSVSGSQSPSSAGLLAVDAQSSSSNQMGFKPLPADSSENVNVAQDNSVNLNLLDVGFAAAAQPDTSERLASVSDDLSDDNGGNDLQSLDAAFDAVWMEWPNEW